MRARLNPYQAIPEIAEQAKKLQSTIEASGLDRTISELIKIRVSQINGCAFCLHMHTHDARKHGETETRIFVLAGWRESRLFNAKERAALAWAESLTHIAERGAPDALFEDLKANFSDREIAALTMQVAMINLWNRLAIGLGSVHPNELEVT